MSSTSYPYGLTQGGVNRSIRTNNSYDRLGRIEHINVDYGYSAPSQPLAHYEYYPTGSVKRVTLGNSIALDYTYHISGAVKTASARNLADNSMLYAEVLFYEDCGTAGCKPQYNGNISRMAHEMAVEGGKKRTSDYVYDIMNRLTDVDDKEQDEFDEYFAYDAQGRITVQRRGANVNNKSGGEYVYYSGTNKLKSVANGMGGTTADKRDMSASDNFEYDADGNMTNDNSKDLTIAYDWRGMPVEFKRQNSSYDIHEKIVCDSTKLEIKYDGSGRRISKTRLRRDLGASDWYVDNVTHYTGIGTVVRESYFGGALDNAKVVVNMPQGLGRYQPEDAEKSALSTATRDENGRPTSWSVINPKFEWYLKNHQGESSENALVHFHCRAAGCCALRHNHLGSTMLVYATGIAADWAVRAAYDYRAFGEQVDLAVPAEKVTENFTGKEKDDETELNYFGARYLDPMLGLWVSVDPARQHFSPYTYGSNNPIVRIDPDGNADLRMAVFYNKDQNGNALPSTLKSEVDRKLSQGLNPIYDTYKVKYFESSAKASDINNFINGGTYGALVIHGEYDEDFYYLHDGNGNEIYPDELKFNVKTLFGACYSKEYLNNRSDNHLVAPEYLPDGRTPSFVESIKFLLDNSDTQKLNESGYEINFTGQ